MKLSELETEEKGRVLQFPRPPRCEKQTTVSLMVPVKQLGTYVMKMLNPYTGEVMKVTEIYRDPDSHLGSLGED